ncbi:FAD-dependent protein [uncultured Parolsenella sp.]|uniref:NAD(P)/FAD-dependent oxidoreductase n=1 Tax=uncultured Parolsenella sp. TaxID=2083008 RepID=UPI0027D96C1D|nr:FAD-binding protein [uncultured Parolsenella sp.]
MLELSGLKVSLDRLDGTAETERNAVRAAVLRRLHAAPDDVTGIELRRRSVDARKKSSVHLTYTVRASLRGGAGAERALLAKLARRRDDHGARQIVPTTPTLPARVRTSAGSRPVVVGAGCAGLFCALSLAAAGLEPLLVERGDDATRRTQAVEHFNETGELDPESNIQFGCGGAGTFSDGKLNTGTKSPLHRLVLETLVDAGAEPEIAWDAKPHIGSDVLPHVVDEICRRITELGGEVRCRTRLTGIELVAGTGATEVRAVTLERREQSGLLVEERVPTSRLVLACGHSARDVFELLRGLGVTIERKTFAMGVRIEHLQADVDRAQYGPAAGHPALGAAPYKLVSHLPNGRSAYSFCMCPGGYVVAAASESGGVVTNGMSLSDRAGANANSGLLANVTPDDLPGDDVLAGVELQRRCERAAFELGGGGYVAPAQLVGDFLHSQPSSAAGRVEPTYPRGVAWGSVEGCLPPHVASAIRAAIPNMARLLRGFDDPEAVLTGVESRSSSPVRVTRGADLQSVSTRGLYPCGEGAGYAGGIMSAATDGLRVAQAVIDAVAVQG